jgi:type II secretory pathway component PulM
MNGARALASTTGWRPALMRAGSARSTRHAVVQRLRALGQAWRARRARERGGARAAAAEILVAAVEQSLVQPAFARERAFARALSTLSSKAFSSGVM